MPSLRTDVWFYVCQPYFYDLQHLQPWLTDLDYVALSFVWERSFIPILENSLFLTVRQQFPRTIWQNVSPFFLLTDKILMYSFVHLIHFYRDNWVWPHQVTFEEKKNTVFVLVSSFSFKPYKEIFHPLSQIKILWLFHKKVSCKIHTVITCKIQQ